MDFWDRDLLEMNNLPLRYSDGPPTTFGDNFPAIFEKGARTGGAYALENDFNEAYNYNLNQIKELTGEDLKDFGLPEKVLGQNVAALFIQERMKARGKDYPVGLAGKFPDFVVGGAMERFRAREAKIAELKKINPSIRTTDEILDTIIESQGNLINYAADIGSRATFGGTLGGLAGGMMGNFVLQVDPVSVATLALGGFGRSATARILTEIGVNAGVEGVIQSTTIRPRDAALGRDLENPLWDIAAAGLGAGAIRGAGELLAHLLSSRATSRAALDRLPQTPDVRAAKALLDADEALDGIVPGKGPKAEAEIQAAVKAAVRKMTGQEPEPGDARFSGVEARPETAAKVQEVQAKIAETEEAVNQLAKGQSAQKVDLIPQTEAKLFPGEVAFGFKANDIDANIIVEPQKDGKHLHIRWIGEDLKENRPAKELALGPRQARQILSSLKEKFPNAETIGGARASGAKVQDNPDDWVDTVVPIPKAVDVKTELPVLQKELRALHRELGYLERSAAKEIADSIAKRDDGLTIKAEELKKTEEVQDELLKEQVHRAAGKDTNVKEEKPSDGTAASTVERAVSPLEEGKVAGKADIGAEELVDENFKVIIDGKEVAVKDILDDLIDDEDLLKAVKECSL